MAVSRVKTWIAEILTAADLNAEFNNILNNGEDLAWPATKAKDLNGNEVIFDADADSSLTVDTDDRLDIRLSGTDLFRFDGTATTPVNGIDFIARATGSPASIQAQGSDSNVALDIRDDNGNELLILAAVASAVNELTLTNAATGNPALITASGETNVGIDIQTKGTGNLLLSTNSTERVRVDENGTLFINDSANVNMTIGLTINQAGNDDQVFAAKSSDVAHGMTSGVLGVNVETDDFLIISKFSAADGGAHMSALQSDNATTRTLAVGAYGGTANTAKTTSAFGLIDFYISEIASSPANTLADITADGNIFCVRRRIGGVDSAAFIVDEDGDLYADGTTGSGATVGLFDGEDDVALCRAFDLLRAEKSGAEDQLIRTEWDDWADEHKERLVELRVIGADGDDGSRGLVNVTQLQRLHNGSICQLHSRDLELMAMIERLTVRVAVAERSLKRLN